MDLYEKVGAANLLLGCVGCWVLLFRTTSRDREYPWEVLMLLRLSLALFLCLLLVSVVLLLNVRAPIGITFVISATKLFAIYAVWKTRTTKFRTGTRTANGNRGDDPNEDVA